MFMKIILITIMSMVGGLVFGQHRDAGHQQAIAPELLFKKKLDMPGVENKEVRMAIVTYQPGEISPAHRHPVALFIYVLEGDIETTYEGEITRLKKGDVFYEHPDGLHNGTKNLSKDKPAKLLVYFLGDPDKPYLVLEPK